MLSDLGFQPVDVFLDVLDHETLTVSIADASISDNGGSTTATVSRSNVDDLSQPLTVNLSSDNTNEATVDATVVIPANSVAATFSIVAVDDAVVGGAATVTISASATGYVVSGQDTLQVVDDVPPVLDGIGSQSVDEGSLATFTASAHDPDVPPTTLTFSLDAGAPAGASIDPVTGVFA